MANIGFWILAVAAVVAGYLVFRVDSMIRATFLLLASFLGVAGILLLLASDFLGAIMVLMMTGEMVIMAVFMVMFMMNPAGLMPMTMVHNHRFSAAAAVSVFAALAAIIVTADLPVRRGDLPADVTVQIGDGMMGPKMLIFLAAGVALLACMIASLAAALDRGRYDRYGDNLDAKVPADPIRGGVGR
jgi:NADH:ubiquinone oxidoreductase subunit 6 (subunit J)